MQQVAEWLEKLGLGQYAQRFAENGISAAALRHLTEQDLKDIGVLLGHRRIILAAISELGGPAAPTASSEATIEPKAQNGAEHLRQAPSLLAASPMSISGIGEAAGERRHVTVMFCDLVDSTGIAAKLDAEEWRDLVGAYLDAASAAVTDMGGKVAKKLGDGLMALFGYPVALENDAERAVRAALAIQGSLAEVNRKNEATGKPALTARIAIDAGPVVVDATGEIFGDLPNIAARAQALAESGSVVVTSRVHRQIAGLFVAEERGSHELKGVPEPVVLYQIVRASGGGRRAGQRHLTPLVGRDEEIGMLMRRWERALQGDGQLVLIVGEPGLGKSRLIEEFHARVRDTPHTWVEWSCSQLLQNTPLHPIAEWGRIRFGGSDVPAERRLADLENTLTLIKLDPAENVPLLAPLLDIPLPKERMLAIAPEELRRRQFAAMTGWTIASASVQPVMLVFEDLHWADPTTLDLLRRLAERGVLAPLFIVATARPEFRPPWSMRSHHGAISLAPLDRSQVRDMVAELSARHALPRDVMEEVAVRTGGVPLFVEEVTRLLLERGEQGGIQTIPPTLQQSLTARLDRLGPAREVAQIGAVIGRDFSYRLLRAVAEMADALLQTALERLAEADILLVQGVSPESGYRFKHALIQEAAYENLLKSRRQALHRHVGEILRDRFADTAAAEPELLAHHFTQAGLTDAAIEWWGKAGDQALRRSAFQEAVSHLGKAVEMADKAGDGPPRAAPAVASVGQRLKLQTDYGQALLWSRGFSSQEAKVALDRAQELAAGTDSSAARFSAYYGTWLSCNARGEMGLGRHTAERFFREAKIAGHMVEAAVASRNLGLSRFWHGDFTEAKANNEEALRLCDVQQHPEVDVSFGQDTVAQAKACLAATIWTLGEVTRARVLIEEAVARAVETAHAPTLTNTSWFKAILETLRGDADATLRDATRVIELSREYGLSEYLAQGMVLFCWARVRRGDSSDSEIGVAELRKAIVAFTAKFWLPFYQGLLAEVEAKRQDVEQALTRIDEALGLAQQTGEHWTDSFLHRIRGEILLKRDPANTAPAEEAFLNAIAIAQQQKARIFELRAAMSMARLMRDQGKREEARELLAPVYGWFTEGFDTRDLTDAKALLDELSS
jgi:class 3 adenylate cyclase/predicted ATPase